MRTSTIEEIDQKIENLKDLRILVRLDEQYNLGTINIMEYQNGIEGRQNGANDVQQRLWKVREHLTTNENAILSKSMYLSLEYIKTTEKLKK